MARDLIALDSCVPIDHPEERGIWLWGEKRSGKSFAARAAFPGLYVKAQNKWWDGYSGQDTVLLEDVDEKCECLGHYFKLWGDSYALTAEVKGSTIPLNFKRFIVTSNYSIDEIFGPDPEAKLTTRQREIKETLVGAIQARFIVIRHDRRPLQEALIQELQTLRT